MRNGGADAGGSGLVGYEVGTGWFMKRRMLAAALAEA